MYTVIQMTKLEQIHSVTQTISSLFSRSIWDTKERDKDYLKKISRKYLLEKCISPRLRFNANPFTVIYCRPGRHLIVGWSFCAAHLTPGSCRDVKESARWTGPPLTTPILLYLLLYRLYQIVHNCLLRGWVGRVIRPIPLTSSLPSNHVAQVTYVHSMANR